MKNRSITYLLLFGICSMLAIMQSCQKTDDLEADINSLKDRVAALEKATEGLNTSFASLQALMQKNKVIIGITPTKDGLGYLLELSDGTSITCFIYPVAFFVYGKFRDRRLYCFTFHDFNACSVTKFQQISQTIFSRSNSDNDFVFLHKGLQTGK